MLAMRRFENLGSLAQVLVFCILLPPSVSLARQTVCYAQNVTLALSNYAANPMTMHPGYYVFTYDVTVTWNCGSGQLSACAVCLKDTLYKDDGSVQGGTNYVQFATLTSTSSSAACVNNNVDVWNGSIPWVTAGLYKLEAAFKIRTPSSPCDTVAGNWVVGDVFFFAFNP